MEDGVVNQRSTVQAVDGEAQVRIPQDGVEIQVQERLNGARILVPLQQGHGVTTRVQQRLLVEVGGAQPVRVVVGEVQLSKPAVGMSNIPTYWQVSIQMLRINSTRNVTSSNALYTLVQIILDILSYAH